ncbi:cytochrome P450 71A1-like [Phragmites australis]|uniref:cytochrome P450 71A1-like n=1 Tax=Phragmites australis TaxID=29695 RepID=UPI002D79A536|nr:cytochrome P450 71A1-like [Phragmites australis]
MAVSLVALVVLLLTIVVPLLYILLLSGKKPAPPQRRGGGNGRRLPPSPPGLPLLGHLHLLGTLPHRALRSVAAAHGPVVLLRLGRVPTVLVSSAAAAEEVMKTRDLAFASRPRSAVADRLLYGRDVAFAPYGEYWRQARRICVVHLLSARRIQSFRRVREQEAAALVDHVRAHALAGAVVDLSNLLIVYTNTVVSRAAFGDESARSLYDDGDKHRNLRKVFNEFQELLGTTPVGEFLPWLGWVDAMRGLEGRIRWTFEALDGLLEKVIDDHRCRPHVNRQIGDDGDGDHRDFVDVLLDVHKNDKEYGIRLETNEIKAIILDMFAAGTDTTYTVMEWAMAELVTHPRAMRRVQDEIRGAVDVGSTGSVTEDHLDALHYLKAVVKETLRLHVPIPLLVPREPPADTEILGYHVPARTRVVINAWAIARDPVTWEKAEEFVPERFLDSSVDYKGQHLELVPFGAGRRGCPGIGFAEATIAMALASLLYHFDWAQTERKSLDMSEMNGMSVHIKSGVLLVVKPWIP